MSVVTVTSTAEAAALLAGAPSPVVVVPVFDSYDDVVRCLQALFEHTEPGIAVLLVDDGGTDRRTFDLLESVAAKHPRAIVVLEHGENQGFVRSCNDAFAATPGRDVVFVNSDVVVGPEWLERLRAAALSADNVATATTLTNHGTIVSVPHRNAPVSALPDHVTPAEAARRVAAGSLRLRPTIPTAIGHCFYVRRRAVDLIGGFDETFAMGYGEEVDFSQRAVAHGFRHVLADDVFTYHRGGGSFGASPEVTALKEDNDRLVQRRYPWYLPWVRTFETDRISAFDDALATARRSLLGLTVAVDGLCLGPNRMGTQHNVVETIRALARRPDIERLIVFTPVRVPPYVCDLRDELPTVEFIGLDLGLGIPERVVDLLYRPYQVSATAELDFLHRAADRFVVNQLDVIAYENPAYFASHAEWVAYRDLTRLSLSLAGGVVFPSEASARATSTAGLVGPDTPCAVVSCGADGPPATGPEERPGRLAPDEHGFLVCIGASYLHKNRRFVIDTWVELRHRGWAGRLVLAGATPPYGNSHAREAEVLLGVPDLGDDVVDLGAISEAEKRWLYRRAALVLYPSVTEGFGLVPFEAAQQGVPTLATRAGSLDEILPAGIPVLDGFDVVESADRAWRLLSDPSAAAALCAALDAHRRCFTWDDVGQRLVAHFDAVLRRPRGRVLALDGEGAHPIGVSPQRQPPGALTRGAATLEQLVRAVIDHPTLKERLSPNGSQRQRVAREVIGRARRRLR